MDMAHILVIHGPNLNLLGTREPKVYGYENLASINDRLTAKAEVAGSTLKAVQSNAEHELIEVVHGAPAEGTSGIIINPAALTHTSVALRDALAGVALPFVEVHLSNVYAREPFRHHSYFSDLALAVITGLGSAGYDHALECLLNRTD